MAEILRAGGPPDPPRKACGDNNKHWINLWNTCDDHSLCCRQMVCTGKNEWLEKNKNLLIGKWQGVSCPDTKIRFAAMRPDDVKTRDTTARDRTTQGLDKRQSYCNLDMYIGVL